MSHAETGLQEMARHGASGGGACCRRRVCASVGSLCLGQMLVNEAVMALQRPNVPQMELHSDCSRGACGRGRGGVVGAAAAGWWRRAAGHGLAVRHVPGHQLRQVRARASGTSIMRAPRPT